MPHPSNVSYPRTEYYRRYYNNNKHRYRMNYEEKKERQEIFNEIYKPYGGEKAYHYNSLMKWLKEAKEEQKMRDLSNISLN
jgi:hypothetical protein